MKLSAFAPKVFLLFLFSFIILGISVRGTHAQTPAQQNNPQYSTQQAQSQGVNQYATPNTNPDVPKNLHTYTQSVMIEVLAGLVCQLAGIDPMNINSKCLGVDPKTGNIGFVESGGGAVGVMGSMIGMFYTPPAHTADFIAYAGQNFGITKQTYAQGVGFAKLSPLVPLWSKFRDIAYMIFVLVFVVVGVAIMLRVRIDPRTVMTIQNQIPKIVIGILLVTFSLAIAGFLIDIMWVFMYLVLNVFEHEAINFFGSPFNALAEVFEPFGMFEISFRASYAIGNIIGGLTPHLFSSILGSLILGPFFFFAALPCGVLDAIPIVGGIISDGVNLITSGFGLFGGGACDLVDTAGKTIIGSIVGLIAFLVILIALLIALFRLWFTLLQAYVSILISIVFAPFWVIGSMIPGSKISFSGWLRNMVGSLSAFPATLVMFLLAKSFMDIFADGSGSLFSPPFIGNPNGERFGSIIALGFILATPNVVKMMRSAFGAPELSFGNIGAAVGAGAGVVTGTAKQTGRTFAEGAKYEPGKGGTWEKVGTGKAALRGILGR